MQYVIIICVAVPLLFLCALYFSRMLLDSQERSQVLDGEGQAKSSFLILARQNTLDFTTNFMGIFKRRCTPKDKRNEKDDFYVPNSHFLCPGAQFLVPDSAARFYVNVGIQFAK